MFRAYLEAERAEGDANVGADVLVLTPEDGILGHREDVVRLPAAVAVGDRGVVHHEPVAHVCDPESINILCPTTSVNTY